MHLKGKTTTFIYSDTAVNPMKIRRIWTNHSVDTVQYI